MHEVWGMYQGLMLGERRFEKRAEKKHPYWKILFLPIMNHGIYDFVLMLAKVYPEVTALLFVIAMLSAASFMLYLILKLKEVEITYEEEGVNIHKVIELGTFSPMVYCTCESNP